MKTASTASQTAQEEQSTSIVAEIEYICPVCSQVKPGLNRIQQHYRDAHGGSISADEVEEDQVVTESEPFLECLYNLNKHAKKYANQASERYHAGRGAAAKRNSVRKEALYGLKSDILQRMYHAGSVDRVKLHEINNREYWLLVINDWEFHVPVGDIRVDRGDSIVDDELEVIDDFEGSMTKEKSNRSLKESLKHIENVVGLSANDYLSQTHISYPSGSYFAGWEYLD